MTQQLGLFGEVAMAPTSAADEQTESDYREARVPFTDACDIAAQYGRETAERYLAAPMVRLRLRSFVRGLAFANDFDADAQELLRNIAWTAADPIVQEHGLPF
jgi:hypothetical protein